MTVIYTKIEFFHNHFSDCKQIGLQFNSNYRIPYNKKARLKMAVETTDNEANAICKKIATSIK